jgi:integrase
MSHPSEAIYRRGKYWLAWDRRSNGELRRPYLTIYWYDPPPGRRVRSASTGTVDEVEATKKLDLAYLSDQGESIAYCPTCGQTLVKAEAYLLADAIVDYRTEHGDQKASSSSIAGRLKHILEYMAENGLAATSCEAATTSVFAEKYRVWARTQPVRWRNKSGDVTVERARSPAAIEESLNQLRAVLNHAVETRRSEARPTFKTLTRRKASSPRRVRCDIRVLQDMLIYAAEPKLKREALHAFLIASMTTIARPDAIFDISIAAHRRQWWPGSETIDLNPAGREQTKKFRPVLPVLPLLAEWLKSTNNPGGWLVAHKKQPILRIDKAWKSMLVALELPMEREWMPYILRHSLATMVRERGASPWDLSGFMGHRMPGQTETYAVTSLYPTVTKPLQDIIDEISANYSGILHRQCTDNIYG